MSRALPVCALLLLPALARAADPPATETVIRLTVQPAGAPLPALKYQLLPELDELSPGNPIQGYLRCFCEQNNFFFSKQAVDDREKWQSMPLKELPAKDLVEYGGFALRQADQAARLDTPDWQILLRLRAAGPFLIIPEIQQMRILASALRVRLRAQVALGRFDDALVTTKTMLALARHSSDHPTLIAALVGSAIAGRTVDPLEEFIGQPGSPNLYWALTDLPSPVIDYRKALQAERMMLKTELRAMSDPYAPLTAETRAFARSMAHAPRTLLEDVSLDTDEARLERVVGRIWLIVNAMKEEGATREEVDIRMWIANLQKDKEYMESARKRLVSAGVAIAKRPDWQIVLLNETLTVRMHNDNALKLMTLPFWEMEGRMADATKTREKSFLGTLTPALDKVRLAQVRLAQRFALLRTIEAIRLHAAEHEGKAPARLADLGVPVPVDPVTGKSFQYESTGASFTLRGAAPKGMEKNAAYNVRYEVTMRK